jgi:hypothetical protein
MLLKICGAVVDLNSKPQAAKLTDLELDFFGYLKPPSQLLRLDMSNDRLI